MGDVLLLALCILIWITWAVWYRHHLIKHNKEMEGWMHLIDARIRLMECLKEEEKENGNGR